MPTRLLIQREPDFASLDSLILQVPQLLSNPELLKGPMTIIRVSEPARRRQSMLPKNRLHVSISSVNHSAKQGLSHRCVHTKSLSRTPTRG